MVCHSSCFPPSRITGVQEEVQLREQDFGNFQDQKGMELEKSERLRFGRFFYRFPNGESGADVYDRVTIFEVSLKTLLVKRIPHITHLSLVPLLKRSKVQDSVLPCL